MEHNPLSEFCELNTGTADPHAICPVCESDTEVALTPVDAPAFVDNGDEGEFTDEDIEQGAIDDVITRVALARMAVLSDEPEPVRKRAGLLSGLVEGGKAHLVIHDPAQPFALVIRQGADAATIAGQVHALLSQMGGER